MADVDSTVLLMTINVNLLNNPNKRQRLLELKIQLYAVCRRHNLDSNKQVENKMMKNIFTMQTVSERAGVAKINHNRF